ncbi:MAG: aminotransferase class I/II-fold pyridoxal phosphate-dependent enzyme [Actinobacteria bacterium]|nr:aminotransferase class I/II-fold pyridoxal phosphate-dependent enzyme [Actinomycetota bacterium]
MRRVDPLLGNCSLTELRQRKSVKWREYPPEVLPSFVAEMDFSIAEPIIAAVTAAVAMSDSGYSHPGQLPGAFARFAADRLGWAPETAHVSPIPDVMTGIAEVVQAITPPGSGIVVNPPVYPPFRFRFGFYGRRLIDAPLARGADGRYALDPDAIEAALSEPGAAAYLLCSPHNPTGNVWSRADLAMVADACQRHGAALLVDEIHAPLALPGARFVPFLATGHELTRAETTFTFTSATKGWNIPGLKCGLAVAGTPAGARLLEERWEALEASHLGVLASVAAFTQGLPWLDAVVGQLDENRKLLASLLAEHLPGVRYAPPQASFLAWLDCRDLGLGDDPAVVFQEKGNVALGHGPRFGAEGHGFARLNIGTSPELLEEAVRRMASAL